MTDNKFNGKWRIVDMDAWAQKFVDLVEPGYIHFENGRSGSLHFICIYADLDYSVDNSDKVVFSFQGDDEGRPISGRGAAKIKSGELHGEIFIHHGERSKFSAKLIGDIK